MWIKERIFNSKYEYILILVEAQSLTFVIKTIYSWLLCPLPLGKGPSFFSWDVSLSHPQSHKSSVLDTYPGLLSLTKHTKALLPYTLREMRSEVFVFLILYTFSKQLFDWRLQTSNTQKLTIVNAHLFCCCC